MTVAPLTPEAAIVPRCAGVETAAVALAVALAETAKKCGLRSRTLAELAPLFQRILQNVIHDHFRRQKVRNLWTTLLSSLQSNDGDRDGSDFDPLETLLPGESNEMAENAANLVESGQIVRIIEAEIQRLPNRQREAFIMRYWQDMDVAETAAAMGCSEGSVKTHCSRATHTLATALRAKGISL